MHYYTSYIAILYYDIILIHLYIYYRIYIFIIYIHILYSMYGHPDTTGIPNMDYFVTSTVEPESAQVTKLNLI